MTHFLTDMSNRVEHQKRNQPAIERWPSDFVFRVHQAFGTECENRVEQKNSTMMAVTAHLVEVLFVQLVLRQTAALITIAGWLRF